MMDKHFLRIDLIRPTQIMVHEARERLNIVPNGSAKVKLSLFVPITYYNANPSETQVYIGPKG